MSIQSGSKLEHFIASPAYLSLSAINKSFINRAAEKYSFSFQEIKQIIDIALDLEMWREGDIPTVWDDKGTEKLKGKNLRQKLLSRITEYWEHLKNEPTDYSNFIADQSEFTKLEFISETDSNIILGSCPVASEKTRCCNLLTLDAVKNCGFDCSYCSIQSFYTDGKIYLHEHFKARLDDLKLDPDMIYHIGTGQSSDSLMWGNRSGILDDLTDFASKNRNVILEFKTKSNAIGYFLKNPIPSNIILTWSLNTDTIINAEEHNTASLLERIDAARSAADNGILVGFHFHPIVEYLGWEDEYCSIVDYIQKVFTAEEVALISLGTLTFIKPVIKKLRERKMISKILQIPLVESGGKLSYPIELKKKLFSSIYNKFTEIWKGKVYFYMCMENQQLWNEIFGHNYNSNEEFESDMKIHYMRKIGWLEDRKKSMNPVN